MKKYLTIFRIGWQRELEYRFNFLLGRLRSIVVLLLLYYIWHTLASGKGTFAGYSRSELITYVLGANILRSIVFGAQARSVAAEINDGTFSTYLVKPVNHFLFVFFRELAQRSICTVSAVIEVALFSVLVDARVFLQVRREWLVLFALTTCLALVLYSLLSYTINLIAFWSREAFGPKFLFDWFLEFASGAYFPMDILGAALFATFATLPFFYLLFFPIGVYLGRYTGWQVAGGIAMQVFWIVLCAQGTRFVWKRGLMRFTGEGI